MGISPRVHNEVETCNQPDPNAQVKYLGLVIERDEELLIELEDDVYVHPPPEKQKRTYVPCR